MSIYAAYVIAAVAAGRAVRRRRVAGRAARSRPSTSPSPGWIVAFALIGGAFLASLGA